MRVWGETARRGEPFEMEYRIVRRDGRVLWIHDQASSILRDGRYFAEGVFSDVTARRQAEHALRQAEDRFRTLVEQMPAIIFMEDPRTGANLYISPQIEALYGYAPQEWIDNPKLWEERLHPEDRDRVVAANRAEDGDAWSVDYRTLTRGGRVLWVHNEAVLVRDDAGEPLYWQGAVYDITERKLAEERVREAEERYRTLVEQLPIAVVPNLARYLGEIKRADLWTYAALAEGGASMWETDLSGGVALVFGAEGKGVRPLVRKTCDGVVSIPLAGAVESLNVSVAAALLLFEARRQRGC